MHRVTTLAAAAGVAALSVLAATGTAHAAAAGTPTLSTSNVAVGHTLTISGGASTDTLCKPDGTTPVSVDALLSPYQGSASNGRGSLTATTTPHADGSWSIALAVPKDFTPGFYTVATSCDAYVTAQPFTSATVDVSAPGRLTRDLAAANGDLSLAGDGCVKVAPGPSEPFVTVGLYRSDAPRPATGLPLTQIVQPAPDGTWSAEVAASTLPPGTYVVEIFCDQNTTDFAYAALDDTIPAATAPGGTLPFTGTHAVTLTATGLALLAGGGAAYALGRRRVRA